jgi:hypothetical protein
MTFAFREYRTDENWTDPESAETQRGVFVIWYKSGENWSMVDVTEAYDVRKRILAHSHGSRACGGRCESGTYYTVSYTPRDRQSGSIEIEQRRWPSTGT